MKAARVNAGLTREEAAKKAGLTAETLRKWENGISIPKPIHLIGMAQIYGVPADIFLLNESN